MRDAEHVNGSIGAVGGDACEGACEAVEHHHGRLPRGVGGDGGERRATGSRDGLTRGEVGVDGADGHENARGIAHEGAEHTALHDTRSHPTSPASVSTVEGGGVVAMSSPARSHHAAHTPRQNEASDVNSPPI